MKVNKLLKKAVVVGVALTMTVAGSVMAFAGQTRGGAFLCDSYSNQTYAGDTHIWYTVGVDYERGYISARTDETSDFRISGTVYDVYELEYEIYAGADQTTACSGSACNTTENQIKRVEYTIRVDGPESGTTISGDEIFWY